MTYHLILQDAWRGPTAACATNHNPTIARTTRRSII